MAENPSNLWRDLLQEGPGGYAYLPSSYHLASLMVNSEGVSSEMAAIDVTSGLKYTFGCTVPSGHNAAIFNIKTVIVDAAITPAKFGGITAFPIGMAIEHLSTPAGSREVLKDFTDGLFIKTTADLALFMEPPKSVVAAAVAVDMAAYNWDLAKDGGPLHMLTGELIGFSIQDSTTGLTNMHAMVRGIVYPDQ